jgi:hypothetical protein
MNYGDLVPRILTPAQYNQLVEIMHAQAELSKASGCNQTIELVFKNGHISFINASNNARATTDGLVMGADYQWREGK